MAASHGHSNDAVELGFVEKCEAWKLKSKFFPGKIGGKPAWLHLKDLPGTEDIKCQKCESPRVFLLQLYAPIDDREDAFHRTVFIFVCKNSECSEKNSATNFVAFRSQLPKVNDFYGTEPAAEVPSQCDTPSASNYNHLCLVCGCLGPKHCAQCKKVQYCSKRHQVLDWKSGHKQLCASQQTESKESNNRILPTPDHQLLFPEFEIISELEEDEAQGKQSERSEEERLAEYRNMLSTTSNGLEEEGGGETSNLAFLEEMAYKGDKAFQKFKKRIAVVPDQVLRYHIGGSPLWVSSEHVPSGDDIPRCECGSERQFEFQIMPQLLNHLFDDTAENKLDWGTVAVFTCKENCNWQTAYHKEFVWKQDFSE